MGVTEVWVEIMDGVTLPEDPEVRPTATDTRADAGLDPEEAEDTRAETMARTETERKPMGTVISGELQARDSSEEGSRDRDREAEGEEVPPTCGLMSRLEHRATSRPLPPSNPGAGAEAEASLCPLTLTLSYPTLLYPQPKTTLSCWKTFCFY